LIDVAVLAPSVLDYRIEGPVSSSSDAFTVYTVHRSFFSLSSHIASGSSFGFTCSHSLCERRRDEREKKAYVNSA
jgi:hypothetical protein